jgi:mRNA-degrading endonuclease toxin of MazEF toxin-antitoxin module
MIFDKGNICFVQKVNAPGENGRPAVIVSESRSNRYAHDVIVCYLSRDWRKQRDSDVVASRFRDGKSFVLAHRPTSVTKSRISGFDGKLTDTEMSRVNAALRLALGI